VPELPEVEALARLLGARLAGRTVVGVHVASVAALKTVDPPVDALVGRRFGGAGRKGKHLVLAFPPLWLVLHLARAGWVQVVEHEGPERGRRGRGPLAIRLSFDDGGALRVTEAGTEKRLAAWVVHDPAEVPRVAALGPDPLDPTFTPGRLGSILAGAGRARLEGVLTDQRLVAGVGNAYADEVLHATRLSPFKPAASLTGEEVARLHAALVGVLTRAVARAEGVAASGLERVKRAGLEVHGRDGEPCPACGDTIRSVWFADRSLQYCPRCQTGGRVLADRRRSRLLK
jgi:formamidopyrimidine-DNA glycosylase